MNSSFRKFSFLVFTLVVALPAPGAGFLDLFKRTTDLLQKFFGAVGEVSREKH